MLPHQVLIKPLITEKTASQEEKGVYIFKVHKNTNKVEIKMAFESIYGVVPSTVRTFSTQGKTSQRRGVKRKPYKKAIITLPGKKTVDISSPKTK